ncbi:MAG: hypothetical protein P4M00_07515 [Azospirillaceae bacterium]|nr:hypothetical protein [Azospirillaceae bacterium]
MATSFAPAELRESCRSHARLLDSFIEMTRAELERQSSAFARESLSDMLDALHEDRRCYGALLDLVTVEHAA